MNSTPSLDPPSPATDPTGRRLRSLDALRGFDMFWILVDVRHWERWAMPFVWIGMNPITVYLGESLVNYSRVAERLAGGSVRHWLDAAVTPGAGQALVSLLTLGIAVLFCRWLYRRQIFLRL